MTNTRNDHPRRVCVRFAALVLAGIILTLAPRAEASVVGAAGATTVGAAIAAGTDTLVAVPAPAPVTAEPSAPSTSDTTAVHDEAVAERAAACEAERAAVADDPDGEYHGTFRFTIDSWRDANTDNPGAPGERWPDCWPAP